MVDPNNETRNERRELDPPQPDIETYIPNEIINPRSDISRQIGDVVWPKDRTGEIVNLGDELTKFRQNQMTAMQSFEAGQIPSQLPMHSEVSERYNNLQIAQLNAMQEIINAEKKAELTEIKAGNLDAARKVSEFNRNRLLEYSKTGAKAIGFTAKYLAVGALWVGKIGLILTKETLKTTADIWYSLWGAHRDYRERYPNQNDI